MISTTFPHHGNNGSQHRQSNLAVDPLFVAHGNPFDRIEPPLWRFAKANTAKRDKETSEIAHERLLIGARLIIG